MDEAVNRARRRRERARARTHTFARARSPAPCTRRKVNNLSPSYPYRVHGASIFALSFSSPLALARSLACPAGRF